MTNAELHRIEYTMQDYHTHVNAKFARNIILSLIRELRIAREIAVTPDEQTDERQACEVQEWR